jgi:hypothetical protein
MNGWSFSGAKWSPDAGIDGLLCNVKHSNIGSAEFRSHLSPVAVKRVSN